MCRIAIIVPFPHGHQVVVKSVSVRCSFLFSSMLKLFMQKPPVFPPRRLEVSLRLSEGRMSVNRVRGAER